MKPEICPCGSELAYDQCCGPCLSGQRHAANAEALMRSRYTAYVRLDENYLLKTWHAATRPAVLGLEHQAATKWLGLKILHIQAGGKNDETGQVQFVARFKIGSKAQRMQENSIFVKEGGRWYYLRAEQEEH